jgi:hypothetical protein
MRYLGPSCTMLARVKSHANPHSSEQDTQPIVFPISKQAAPYQTRGGTCCPRVSTPKIRSLIDSSTTCHDGINHFHHSNHCSNHIIDPHTVKSHLDKWEMSHPGCEKTKPKPLYVCLECSNHTYSNNMVNIYNISINYKVKSYKMTFGLKIKITELRKNLSVGVSSTGRTRGEAGLVFIFWLLLVLLIGL